MSNAFIDSLRAASKYLLEHRHKTILISVDEATLIAPDNRWVEDLLWLHRSGVKLVVVPDLGVTDEAVDASQLAQLMQLSAELYRTLQGQIHRFSTNGELVQTQLIRCLPTGILGGIDYQRLGRISSVHKQPLRQLLDQRWIVWQSPSGYSPSGQVYVCEVNHCLMHLAEAAAATKIIHLGHAKWLDLVGHKASAITSLSLAEFKQWLLENRSQSKAFKRLLTLFEGNVKRVHLLDSCLDGCLIEELFSTEGSGLLIHDDGYDGLVSADESHIQGILKLIQPALESQAIRPRTQQDLDQNIADYWVLLRDSEVVGCVALSALEQDCKDSKNCFELTCLVVAEAYQNRQFASLLLKTAIAEASRRRAEKIFTLTTVAENWFMRHGFEVVELDQLPPTAQDAYCLSRNSRALCLTLPQ